MDSLELIVVVAAAVLLMGWLSRRTGLSEPLLLLAVGCLVGLTPSFSSFALSPDVVLFLFLPALLYWEALTPPYGRSATTSAASRSSPPGWSSPPP
jgi:CPA1 family monovalent cation:H+ antiporter